MLSHHFLRQEVTLLHCFFYPEDWMSANNFLLGVYIHAVRMLASSPGRSWNFTLLSPSCHRNQDKLWPCGPHGSCVPSKFSEGLNLLWMSNAQNCTQYLRYKPLYMLQVKFDFRLSFFNLGWFSISFDIP